MEPHQSDTSALSLGLHGTKGRALNEVDDLSDELNQSDQDDEGVFGLSLIVMAGRHTQ